VLNTVGAAREGAPAPPAEAAPIWRDRVYSRIVADLRQRFEDVRLLAVRYRGLDLAGHQFLPTATPIPFLGLGDVRGNASSLGEYYRHVDIEVGTILDLLGSDDLFLVVSGFGMEPVGVSKRVLARIMGDPDATGTHERAPDGFILAYGSHVEPGRRPRGSVVDVAPTVLYYLGVPVARDVDGVVRTDIFTKGFRETRPITFVPSYDR
jgi:predicted AlkP superfamily phosphohydrolase/phosphomutase